MTHTEEITENRLNGLVEFGFWLDLVSDKLKKAYDKGGKAPDDAHEWIGSIRDDYKLMVSNRMNELTKKNLNIKD